MLMLGLSPVVLCPNFNSRSKKNKVDKVIDKSTKNFWSQNSNLLSKFQGKLGMLRV